MQTQNYVYYMHFLVLKEFENIYLCFFFQYIVQCYSLNKIYHAEAKGNFISIVRYIMGDISNLIQLGLSQVDIK